MEDRTPDVNAGIEAKLEIALRSLLALLEKEREALLAGDAKEVANLSTQKERAAEGLAVSEDDLDLVRRSDVVRLVKRVGDLATSNHALLEQMYRHYNGMLELILRLAGQTATYGPTGAMNEVSRLDARSHRIIA